MGLAETEDYIKGLDRRSRIGWEQTRSLMRLIYKVLSGEDLEYPFPWDEKEEIEPITDEDMIAMRERAKIFEDKLNKRDNG